MDVTTLKITVDSRGVDKGKIALDQLANAARRAQAAMAAASDAGKAVAALNAQGAAATKAAAAMRGYAAAADSNAAVLKAANVGGLGGQLQGAAGSMGKSMGGLGAAILSIVSPTRILTRGFDMLVDAALAALGALAAEAWKNIIPEIKTVDELLAGNEASLRLLGRTYAEAGGNAKNLMKEDVNVVDRILKANQADKNKLLDSEIESSLGDIFAEIGEQRPWENDRFAPFRAAIKEFSDGKRDVISFRQEVDRIGRSSKAFDSTANELISFTNKASASQIALSGMSTEVDRVQFAFAKAQEAIDAVNPSGATGKLAEVERKAKELLTQAEAGEIGIHDFSNELNRLSTANFDLSHQIDNIRGLGEQAIRTRIAIHGLANTTPKTDRLGAPQPLDDLEFHKRFNAGWSQEVIDQLSGRTNMTEPGLGGIDETSAANGYDEIAAGADKKIAALLAERDMLGMTEEAAAALRYEQELLNQAEEKGLKLRPEQSAHLKLRAEMMAGLEAGAKKAREAMEFAKELTKGFVSDLRQGLANGEGFWRSFSNAALNALDRVVDKLLNEVLDALFQVNSSGAGGGGSWWQSLLDNIGGLFGAGGEAAVDPWDGLRLAKGGAFAGGVQMFAHGGAFSNSIVGRPTLFPFANGIGLMGEAGPEAIMPLRRDSQGRLGVSAANQNGAGTTVQIVDQRGGGTIGREETTGPNGEQLVRLIIKDELRTYAAGSFSRHVSNNAEAKKRIRGY